MKLKCILENVEIFRFDPEGDIDSSYDQYDIYDQAMEIANNVNIRIANNKELAFVALDQNEKVYGSTWTAIYNDNDQEAMVYDFDITIKPKSPTEAFLKLINNTLKDFEYFKSEEPRSYIRVWVVNPRLAEILERRYNFEVEGVHGNGSCHMVKY